MVFTVASLELRNEVLSIMQRVLSLLEHGPVQGDIGEALRGFHERHRNEIWDTWRDEALEQNVTAADEFGQLDDLCAGCLSRRRKLRKGKAKMRWELSDTWPITRLL